jgi:dTDP-4-amino-4,6-dideoxygalactose transaminase
MTYRIPFNKPFIAGKELFYIAQAVTSGQIAADGMFTSKCTSFFEERFQICRALMTPSCTAALEMAAILCDLSEGDEVIMPSFSFVSTANAVVRLGAKPVFVDIRPDTLNMNEELIASAVSPRTKMILPVHYAGVACEMGAVMDVARERNIWVVEDAAQGVNAYYEDRALGSIGHLGTYSFHETKNYICGEGGALCVNAPELVERAEIIRDKGTNRQQFFRGQVDKYTWLDIGSSYVPSEICSAFLWGQLEQLDVIAQRRREIYERYRDGLAEMEQEGLIRLPRIPEKCRTNYHIFYVLFATEDLRNAMIEHLGEKGILAVFHYVPLHTAPMGKDLGYKEGDLPITEDLSGRLLRLPIYFELGEDDQLLVIDEVVRCLTR